MQALITRMRESRWNIFIRRVFDGGKKMEVASPALRCKERMKTRSRPNHQNSLKIIMQNIEEVLNLCDIKTIQLGSNRIQGDWPADTLIWMETDVDSNASGLRPEPLSVEIEIRIPQDSIYHPEDIKFKRNAGSIEEFHHELKKLLLIFRCSWETIGFS